MFAVRVSICCRLICVDEIVDRPAHMTSGVLAECGKGLSRVLLKRLSSIQ
jgi:hypothetical protein